MRQNRCTVQRGDGSFCDAESGKDVPFPICDRHGFTGRLRPPNAVLLATEPGGHDVEEQRIRQFAHLRVSGKGWCRPELELLQFIDGLNKATVAPTQ